MRKTLLCTTLLSAAATLSAQTSTDYALSFAENQAVQHASRRLNGITLSSKRGQQQLTVPTPTRVFNLIETPTLHAQLGDTVRAHFDFTTQWMNGYVYLDRGRDGQFEASLTNARITPGSDLLAFSHYRWLDSQGEVTQGATVDPPAFALPADVAPGVYRLRFKVDWDEIDPAGSQKEGNDILKNGGTVTDAFIALHGSECRLHTQLNGAQATTTEGQALPEQVAAAQPFVVQLSAPEGKMISAVRLRHGFGLAGEAVVRSARQWQETTIPSFLIKEGRLTLPAEALLGECELSVELADQATNATTGEDYALAFEPNLRHTNPPAPLTTLRLSSQHAKAGSTTLNLAPATGETDRAYLNFTDEATRQFHLTPGAKMTVLPVFEQTVSETQPRSAYFFMDLNQDGQFTPLLEADGRPNASSELLSYSQLNGRNSAGVSVSANVSPTQLPSFSIPEALPAGVYRARLVLQHNAADASGVSAEALSASKGQVVDFLVNVHETTAALRIATEHGNVYAASTTQPALPMRITAYRQLAIRTVPSVPGYDFVEGTVRHGYNLEGPQFVHGNRQWDELRIPKAGSFTLPPHATDANVLITARFAPSATADYQPILVEEFNGADGSQPSAERWTASPREGATWNRWISSSPEVAFVDQGELVCRAIPTPAAERAKGETAPMITGSMESRGKFKFQYGRVEARLRTNGYKGNFPAFWMMPNQAVKGWPHDGEIDIWEQINNDQQSLHTIHTNWSYNLGNTNNPRNTQTVNGVDMTTYHTYALEWTPELLTWFVDGQQVFSYAKSKVQGHLDNGQWPFDREFFLILNQSVGKDLSGGWALYPDTTHTYETRFDYVRVYQTAEQRRLSAIAPITTTTSANSADAQTFDLAGRRVEHAEKGVFIRNKKKVILP